MEAESEGVLSGGGGEGGECGSVRVIVIVIVIVLVIVTVLAIDPESPTVLSPPAHVLTECLGSRREIAARNSAAGIMTHGALLTQHSRGLRVARMTGRSCWR